MNRFFSVLISFCALSTTLGQEKSSNLNIKIGKISAADFVVNSPVVDSNANAVILSDIGSSEFESDSKGWFALVFKRHKRVKILNEKGYDAAVTALYLYSNGTETEKLNDIRGFTYNLENNQPVIQKLESKDIFEERLSKNLVRKKFTFPGVKAGSIIEYSYTIRSEFLFNLQPWEFQSEYPVLWSEYEVATPDFFNYVFISQGYHPFHTNSKSDHNDNFLIRSTGTYGVAPDNFRISTITHRNKWIMKDVPALKEESFTSTINNHIAKIEFQLSQYRFPNEPIQEVMGTWQTVAEKLLERQDFGRAYRGENGFLDNDLESLLNNTDADEVKARKIYAYIRDNFTCTRYAGIYIDDFVTLKDVFKKRSGSVSEINLLLIAMLRKAKLKANPVILGLRNKGVVHMIYPLLNRFNYVVTELDVDGKKIYLDATRPFLGFGKLEKSCYNGTAWAIREIPERIQFSPDSLFERKIASAFFVNDDAGKYTGTLAVELGANDSYKFRENNKNISKKDFLSTAAKGIIGEINLTDFSIDSLNNKDLPVTLRYNADIKFEEDIIYFNPLFGFELKTNPFKSENRLYPIEMPYLQDEMFILNMEIPKGYIVDEIPKSVRYKLNDDEGMFEYLCQKSETHIKLRSRMNIKKADFPQEAYPSLREFYGFILKKHAEQIVFKKKVS